MDWNDDELAYEAQTGHALTPLGEDAARWLAGHPLYAGCWRATQSGHSCLELRPDWDGLCAVCEAGVGELVEGVVECCRIFGRQDRESLRGLARATDWDALALKRRLIRTGLLDAFERRAEPTAVRIGPRWATDSQGERLAFVPWTDLSPDARAYWLATEAKRFAHLVLRTVGRPDRPREEPPLVFLADVEAADQERRAVSTAEALGDSHEVEAAQREVVQELIASASPGQAEHLRAQLEFGSASLAASAREAGLAEKSVGPQLRRVRAKAMARISSDPQFAAMVRQAGFAHTVDAALAA